MCGMDPWPIMSMKKWYLPTGGNAVLGNMLDQEDKCKIFIPYICMIGWDYFGRVSKDFWDSHLREVLGGRFHGVECEPVMGEEGFYDVYVIGWLDIPKGSCPGGEFQIAGSIDYDEVVDENILVNGTVYHQNCYENLLSNVEDIDIQIKSIQAETNQKSLDLRHPLT